MRSIGWLFVCLLILSACIPTKADASSPDAAISLPVLRPSVASSFTLQAPRAPEPWPNAHPPGTLLIDHLGDLWMVENWLERRLVSGDDILGEINLGDETAIPMSEAEERCLIPVDDEYWYPASTGWYDYYSPVSDDISTASDDGFWLINWDRRLRRRSSIDARKSWGYGPWTNDFTEGDGDWASFRPVGGPLGFRDGSLYVTEYDEYYYMIDDRAWLIDPVLAESVGYNLADAHHTLHDRFFRQTSYFGELVREFFTICPALEPIGENPDHDGDGSPFARDCDDRTSDFSPLNAEGCNGIDDNCDGLIDDVEECFGAIP